MIVLGVLMPIVMLAVSARNIGMRAAVLLSLAYPASVHAAITTASLLGPLWAAALGANIVGAEYQYGTWPLLLVRTTNRWRLLLVKILVTAGRITALTTLGTVIFAVVAAIVCTVSGVPLRGAAVPAGELLIPLIGVGGAMAFAAAIAFTLTVVTRSVVFGTLIGALALPLCSSLRFKETAVWIPYVHFENLQSRWLTGQPPPQFLQFYGFNMSATASAAMVAAELIVVFAIAFLVFRQQEIVY